MADLPRTRGLVMFCSPEGRILEILHDGGLNTAQAKTLDDLVSPEDAEKLARFLERARTERSVFGWELTLRALPGPPLLFGAVVFWGWLLVI